MLLSFLIILGRNKLVWLIILRILIIKGLFLLLHKVNMKMHNGLNNKQNKR